MGLTVSEVSKLSGVSVRTLHHYDALGLLSPSHRSDAGYRLYEEPDLLRLQQILFFRELGLSLERIHDVLTDPEFDLKATLRVQRQLLAEESIRLRAVLSAVEQTLEALERGTTMTKEEMFEVFGGFDPEAHAEEAEQRWGDTEAFKESARRTKRYTKQDWARFKTEQDALNASMVAAMRKKVAPESAEGKAVAEAARLLIDRWFYPCPKAMHAKLGEMYVADARFTANYETLAPGLAAWVSAAIAANAKT